MGRKLGLTDDDIAAISELKKENFKHIEWVALRFARDYALSGGKQPEGDDIVDFFKLYSDKEKRCILRVAAKMDFFNRLMASISKPELQGVTIKEKM